MQEEVNKTPEEESSKAEKEGDEQYVKFHVVYYIRAGLF